MSVTSLSEMLKEKGMIRSTLTFRALYKATGQDTHMRVGYYDIHKKVSVYTLVEMMLLGPTRPLVVLAFGEGSKKEDVMYEIQKEIKGRDSKKVASIIEETKSMGYLFPETYYIDGNESEYEVIMLMLQTFTAQYNRTFLTSYSTTTIREDGEVKKQVILASVLQGEANNKKDMQMIADILKRRMKLGMRLQVDVAKETYTQAGLPLSPINNPGIDALYAARYGIENEYLFYLTGKDGIMHYAITFEEHKKNIAKYLK